MRVEKNQWRGDRAWSLKNDTICVVFTETGGQIASLRGAKDGPEALWQPPWPAARPSQADSRWGPPEEAPLLANICGWNLCLDRFGVRANDGGRPLHGEAGILPWTVTVESEALRARVELPLAGLTVQRRLGLQGCQLLVETEVAVTDDKVREIEWCEHITLGDPLLEDARIEAMAEEAILHPDCGAAAASRFADCPAGSLVAVEEALAMPAPDAPAAGGIVSLAMREGRWRVENPSLGWRLSCDYEVELFPWLCLWTEHRARQARPWNGITRSRGMECSSKPFPEGAPPAERHPVYRGRSTRLTVAPERPLQTTLSLRWEGI